MKNSKTKGELGEKIAMTELAKYGLDIAIPLSDNLPIDLIVMNKKGKLFKVQVKSSTEGKFEESIIFSCRTSNWWKKENKKYNQKDFDVFIGCDLNDYSLYLFKSSEVAGRNAITLRKKVLYKSQIPADKYAISERRIKEVFK